MGTDEVEGGREDDYVEDVVDQTWLLFSANLWSWCMEERKG